MHSNFAEYTPITLLLLYFLEEQGAIPGLLLNALCFIFLVGRILHAYGVSQVKEDFRFRVTGMVLTFFVINLSAVCLLWRLF